MKPTDKPVATHFNTSGHSVEDAQVMIIAGLSETVRLVRLALALNVGQADHPGPSETVRMAAPLLALALEVGHASRPSDGLCSRCSKKDEPERTLALPLPIHALANCYWVKF